MTHLSFPRWIMAMFWLLIGLTAHAVEAEYILGSGDVIKITVFQNPDLTVETRVSETGLITYPLLGSVPVGKLSVSAAEQKIANLLRDGSFVMQPQVNILVEQVRGNQVSVLGQVNRPGRYPLEMANSRLSDILALAGGITPLGADTLVIVGTRDGKPFRREIDFPAIYIDNQRQDDLVVAGGDVIYIHRAPMYYIYGEAQRSGSYRIERGMTVQQALAQGGGPTLRGTENRIRIHRRSPDGKVVKVSPDLSEPVQADDVIYVNESLF